ncbi:hypothetical protein E3N88_12239 [Mikania micrantha]|uniref:C2 domain-containing protein n=1 Tax=Mikania micrantha TaxID=192012 RepID=A0A5N6P4Y0_9ASTR|nr:hypothetical protein E3N88_12239 [Mikania micrantha]
MVYCRCLGYPALVRLSSLKSGFRWPGDGWLWEVADGGWCTRAVVNGKGVGGRDPNFFGVDENEHGWYVAKQNNHQAARSYLPPKPSQVIEFGHDNNSTKLPQAINDYGRGLLVVTIHEGKFISRRERQLYLYVGHENRATKKTEKNEYPIWKEQFTFTVEKPTTTILRLKLLSYPSWYQALSTEENVGSLDISIAEVVKEKHINKLYTIGYGQLLVELLWRPLAGGVGDTVKIHAVHGLN